MNVREMQLIILNISLLSSDHFLKVIESKADQLFDGIHSQVFDVISSYYFEYQQLPNYSIIEDELKALKLEKEEIYLSVVDSVQSTIIPESVTLEYVRDKLREHRRKNKLIDSLKSCSEKLKSETVEAAYDEVRELIYRDSEQFETETVDKGDLQDEALQDLFEILDPDNVVEPGVQTGLIPLDEATFGLQPGELALVSARPAVGKSTLLLNIGFYNYYYYNKNVVYISLEMPKAQLKRRLYSRAALVDYSNIKTKNLSSIEKDALTEVIQELAAKQNHFYIFDISHKIHAGMLETYLIPIFKKFPVDLLIVDYLGEMISKSASSKAAKWEIQGEAARELRAIGRKYKVPIWTATQLTRESTKQKSLDSTHIAGSDMIAQIADLAIALQETDENKIAKEIEVAFLKVRDAEKIDQFKVHCNKSKMLIGNIRS